MHEVISFYRALQLFAHNAHNLAKGQSFFEDHEFFVELYPVYEAAYDSLVEREIGLQHSIDLNKIQKEAADMAARTTAGSDENSLKTILESELHLLKLLEKAAGDDDTSFGTQNLLQDLADQSEARIYQIRRRLAK